MGDYKKRLLLATGQESINEAISRQGDFEIVGTVDKRESIEQSISQTNPAVVLVSEGMAGNGFLPSILLEITAKFPYMRIIYLAGEVSVQDELRMEPIRSLARAGIYDIIHSGQIKKRELFYLLNNPMSEKDASHLLVDNSIPDGTFDSSHQEAKVEYSEIPESIRQMNNESEDSAHEKHEARVIAFSSIKPGTGKSFIAVNVASAIAQYGIDKKDGKRPKVALIEADLQNLSVGTLLKMDEGDNHLIKAMNIIKSLINPAGALTADEGTIKDANKKLLKCLTPYNRLKNLEVLAGSQTSFREAQDISHNYYSYLISALKPHFDYIIIDSNSSMAHTTTFPILRMSDDCYYILNLDFNNIRNNIRYEKDLAEWKVLEKVKYVLNQDYVPGKNGGKLSFGKRELEDVGFKIEAAIPSVEQSVFLNSIYDGVPIVLGSEKESENARYEILKIANQIHQIMNFSENSGEELINKKRKGLRGR